MKIKVQSFIDVITNSSTSVYQVADSGSVQMVEDLIDTILKMGGSGMRCKDIFKITIKADDASEGYYEYALEALKDTPEWNDSDNFERYSALKEKVSKLMEEDWKTRDRDAIYKLEDEMVKIGVEDGILMSEGDWIEDTNEGECREGGHPIETIIRIEPINYIPSSSQKDILGNINRLFESYALYG